MSQHSRGELCTACGKTMQRSFGHSIAITGTRDNFGVRNSFVDPDSGKEVDTWRKWEKEGYRDKQYAIASNKRDKRNKFSPGACSNRIAKVKEKMRRIQKKPITVGG